MQVGLEPGGDPGRAMQHHVGVTCGRHADQDAFGGLPYPMGPRSAKLLEQIAVRVVGQEAQGQFTKCGQVVGLEEARERLLHVFGRVDVAVQHAPAELLRRRVDQLDLVGAAQHRVGDAFAHAGTGHLFDDVGEALDVLHVDGGDDTDIRHEQLEDVLPALGVAPGLGHVAVGQFVDEHQFGVTGQDRIDVHFLEPCTLVVHHFWWHDVEAGEQPIRGGAAMCRHETDRHVAAAGGAAVTFVEHRVRLADAGGHAEIDAETSGSGHRSVGPRGIEPIARIPDHRPALAHRDATGHPAADAHVQVGHLPAAEEQKVELTGPVVESASVAESRADGNRFGGDDLGVNVDPRAPSRIGDPGDAGCHHSSAESASFSSATLTWAAPRNPSCGPCTWVATRSCTRAGSR